MILKIAGRKVEIVKGDKISVIVGMLAGLLAAAFIKAIFFICNVSLLWLEIILGLPLAFILVFKIEKFLREMTKPMNERRKLK